MSANEASTTLLLIDNRSGVQISAAEGTSKNYDFSLFGGFFGGFAGAGGGYPNTPQGKVVVAPSPTRTTRWSRRCTTTRRRPSRRPGHRRHLGGRRHDAGLQIRPAMASRPGGACWWFARQKSDLPPRRAAARRDGKKPRRGHFAPLLFPRRRTSPARPSEAPNCSGVPAIVSAISVAGGAFQLGRGSSASTRPC